MNIKEFRKIDELINLLKENGYSIDNIEKIFDNTEIIICLRGNDFVDPFEINIDVAIDYFKKFFIKKTELINIVSKLNIKEVTKKNAFKYINRGFNLLRDSIDRIYNLSTVRGLILGEIGLSSTNNANDFYNNIKQEIMNIICIDECINDEDLENEPHIDF